MTYRFLTNAAKVVDWARQLVTDLNVRDVAIQRALNAIPSSITLSETTTPNTPATGYQVLFIDSADHKLKRKDSSGTVTVLG